MAAPASDSLATRLLSPFAQVREGEAHTALLMFAYSFLAMTSYNIIQPITRSRFIADLGAANIPYVQFAAGFLVSIIMQGYSRLTALLPRKWVIPLSQAALVGILVLFWVLFQTGQQWVSVAFYLLGLIFAILLVSQFWTLANTVYDARQAKRLFGFIGGGTVLGGMTGAGITTLIAETVGTNTLLLFSAAILASCIFIVMAVLKREGAALLAEDKREEEQGPRAREALKLFLSSRQMQLIGVIITMGALGAAILDQQLNMATEAFRGGGGTDSMTAFLGSVRFYLSLAGLVIQMFLTSRIHRLLGVGFALMVLPVSLGLMARSHPLQRRLVGARAWQRGRPIASLHGRQDHAGDPLPAVANRRQASGQAIRGRLGRSHGERHRRVDPARVDQALGTQPLMAATELRHPGARRRLGCDVDSRQARVRRVVPSQHRAARHAPVRNPSRHGGSEHDGNPRPRVVAPRSQARHLRDRPARIARQAPAGHTAPPPSRIVRGARPGARGRGRSAAEVCGALDARG